MWIAAPTASGKRWRNSSAPSRSRARRAVAIPRSPILLALQPYTGYALELLAAFTGDPQYYRQGLEAHLRAVESDRAEFARLANPQHQRDYADALAGAAWCAHLAASTASPSKWGGHALALMEPVSLSDPSSLERGTIWPRLPPPWRLEQAAGRVSDGLRHLAKARSMVGLPERSAGRSGDRWCSTWTSGSSLRRPC